MTTVADLLESVGGVPADRVLLHPTPGTATEADLLAAADAPRKRICELIDGVLVEKPMGIRESFLARRLVFLLELFVFPRNLGLLTVPDGMMRLFPGRIRVPDVAFIGWDRLPGRRYPTEPVPNVHPDLAAEVLSRSNTPAEMLLKRQDYFRAGVVSVWEIDPDARTVAVYTTADAPDAVLTAADTLAGEPALPGFALPLAELFAELDRHG